MPITPRFRLSQTTSQVTVVVRVPHVRVSVDSTEVLVDGPTLHFASPPYLLVLTFPEDLAGDDNDGGGNNTARYDPSKDGGNITMVLTKRIPRVWSNLDLIGNLVRPANRGRRQPLRAAIVAEERIEQEGGAGEADQSRSCAEPRGEDALPGLTSLSAPRYGFLHRLDSVFSDLARDGLAAEMLQLPNPDEAEVSERRKLRVEFEDDKFDPDRYLGDLDMSDDYLYQCAMELTPHWRATMASSEGVEEVTEQMEALTTSNEHRPSYFSEEETLQFASIPYPLLPSEIGQDSIQQLLWGLLDLLFAYTYDYLLTCGDPTVESSWTISTLSCLLSWLDDSFSSTHDVVCQSLRRSLIFPYIRNLEFSLHCWYHVLQILQLGRRCVLRSLLQVRQILETSEVQYLGNKLYIDPYLSWLQRCEVDRYIVRTAVELETVLRTAGSRESWVGEDVLGLQLRYWEEQMGSSSEEEDSEEEEEDDGDGDDDGESSDASAIGMEKKSSVTSSVLLLLEEERPPKSTTKPLIQEL